MSYLEKLSIFSKVAYRFPGLLINPAKIKFGVYRIKKNCNYISVFKVISYNKQASLPFKIKNGMSSIQIKEEMLQNQNFRGKFPESISEGAIIPDTYHFAYGIQRSKAIQYMLQKSKARRDKLWKEYRQRSEAKSGDKELRASCHPREGQDKEQIDASYQPQIFKDEQEWIIFASILEKEGISYEDKRKIAGVILNRMKKKMRLEIDATAIYIKTSGRYNKKLRWNEIQSGKFELDDGETISYRSPYNTYRNKGLPPGPICNPSIESLSAALNPEKHDYLYYRVIDANKHVFSEDFEKHKSVMREKNNNNKASMNNKTKK